MSMDGVVHVMSEDMEEAIMREDMENGVLPPGFRFHPTDEELISFYLGSKVFHGAAFSFPDVDLNRVEPWELPESGRMGEREWYLFSLRDRKYPTGLRTNRATGAGYWKATGKDREVHSPHLRGLKKTLVFYKGRAPRGHKTKWVMHEYRLLSHHRHTSKDEWVMCRIYHKAVGDKTKFPLLLQERGIGIGCSNMEGAALPPLLESEGLTGHDPFSFQEASTESMFFKSLLSHQPGDSIWDLLRDQNTTSTTTSGHVHVLKQCKTEADSTMQHWVDPYQSQSLLFNNNNCYSNSSPIFGFPPTISDHHDYYLSNSSSFAFNKTPATIFPINIATLLDP